MRTTGKAVVGALALSLVLAACGDGDGLEELGIDEPTDDDVDVEDELDPGDADLLLLGWSASPARSTKRQRKARLWGVEPARAKALRVFRSSSSNSSRTGSGMGASLHKGTNPLTAYQSAINRRSCPDDPALVGNL
jgi:hypothetical protein